MNRPLSQLIHVPLRDGTDGPRMITLHDRNQHARDVATWGLGATATGRVIGLESYKGVFRARTITGYTWFVGPDDRPGPVFFGDALSEIERFLWDEVDRQRAAGRPDAELPFLLGVGQGAIMAIATALAVPDLLSGAIAVGPSLPVVPGWDPPLAPMTGLPILLVGSVPDTSDPAPVPAGVGAPAVLRGDELVSALTGWGATVTSLDDAGSATLPGIAAWLAARERRALPAPAGQASPG
ncbi:MAG TPA: hypothetical protein VGT61_08675 [Thermomicrobiales bacterium]|jgi:pimeloyl-ACP methyl ester carboxylesterase|nr:hypothetical protein [Thermomicrobiales bacterium]